MPIFAENFDFWPHLPKYRFFAKTAHLFNQTFRFFTKFSIFNQNYAFLSKIVIFEQQKIDFVIKFQF